MFHHFNDGKFVLEESGGVQQRDPDRSRTPFFFLLVMLCPSCNADADNCLRFKQHKAVMLPFETEGGAESAG